MQQEHYDLIVAGTGFASSFFLHRYLQHAPNARVLVLERGKVYPHRSQVEGARKEMDAVANSAIVNANKDKRWRFLVAYGGGSNCWVACTPRMLPADFRLNSTYGVGVDWPISYDDLEPYYCDAEDLMQISGPSDDTPFPRSRPYPQPPHRFTHVDKVLKQAWPDSFFHQPTARPSQPTTRRPLCCLNGTCTLCPINSKFTVMNELSGVHEDPRVTMLTDARVDALEVTGGQTVSGVRYKHGGAEQIARADLVVLGTNALFNPHILMKSGLTHPVLGRGLVEQVAKMVIVDLDGLDNFQGSTYVTGHGYMLYDGPHRAEHAAALIETYSRPDLRMERGKWRQRLRMRVIYEDLPQHQNHVQFDPSDPLRPVAVFEGHSAYTQRAIDRLDADMEKVLASLPVEKVKIAKHPEKTESHIIGTTPMGDNTATSIVDRNLVHHDLRNLYVLGSGVYPTCAPANPTLTLSALALRAADHATGRSVIA